MDAEVHAISAGDLAVHPVAQRYPLEPGLWLVLTPEADAWRCSVEADDPAGDEPRLGAEALTHLLRYQLVPPVERFELVRHLASPEASGERPVDDDGHVVVVGERVVVSRARLLRDVPYTAPVTLAQLAALDFLGVPDTHGLLVWTTPNGREAPVAVVTRYLPRAVDGRNALIRLLAKNLAAEPSETPTLAARMGRITAALHVALATRTSVLAEPVRPASPAELRAWHERVRGAVDRAALIAAEGTVPGVGQHFLGRLGRLEADADVLAALADAQADVPFQRVHGDLHAARILRWAGGLAITGFGDEPDGDPAFLGPQPAVRDLARLLQSFNQLAAELDEQAGTTAHTTEWLPGGRNRVISAYRTELGVAGRTDLFDERLLAAFEAEHAAREVIAAAHRQAAAESVASIDPHQLAGWRRAPEA
jgi:predicted trehalose synthase